MLCHHAYLHGTGLTTIFSIFVFVYEFALYIKQSEKPLTLLQGDFV